jgi:polyphosphate kinase
MNMRTRLEELILREIEVQKEGQQGHLIFKMNALEDPEMIKLLYRASQAGVKVDLLVRGLCCLRAGVAGVSDNIRVISIVGRFLEHSRIYYFGNNGQEEVYIGSADWMPRNLYERVEVLTPLKDPMARERVRYEILEAYLADNLKTRVLARDGSYHRVWQTPGKRGGKPPAGSAAFNAQEFLISLAEGKQTLQAIPASVSRPRRAAQGVREARTR